MDIPNLRGFERISELLLAHGRDFVRR